VLFIQIYKFYFNIFFLYLPLFLSKTTCKEYNTKRFIRFKNLRYDILVLCNIGAKFILILKLVVLFVFIKIMCLINLI
jgi:hypothetical protein